ncbi:acyl-CoA dehydrogenase family protein [Streptomyces sp. NRRL WC-3618]|uniref:acyl-CoA dehydrogenase family protein n=1 Tax=Streptomyces sp. NRRL WC-3618 TaxID=1519490 RepID=UPI0007C7A9EB|nr:acyl-CoA dehydrogenase family protein [Streptomyces sp. NRRL WC-3618]
MTVGELTYPLAAGPASPRAQVQEALADPEVRDLLDRLADPGVREPDVRPLYRALGRRGLLAVNWPEEYGGLGLGLADAAAVAEELVRAGVPDTLHVNSVQIVGLFLLMAGTPEQKARHLPALADGSAFASVLYTEPGTGSDLAALETVATVCDGGFELTGTKSYSLKSDITDIALCAARTGEPGGRYRGITLFLVDLHAPGVRREVIHGIADEQFHRIRLDGVRVPAADVIGPVGGGWPLLTKALAVERTGLDYSLKAERWYAAALAELRDSAATEENLAEIGRFGAEVEAGRLLSWDVIDAIDASAGAPDDVATATAKYLTSETAQGVACWANRLTGGARTRPGARSAVLEAAYREAPGLTLSAGTSEVMLQIIASAGTQGAQGAQADRAGADPLLRQLRAAVRDRLGAAVLGRDRDTARAVHGPAALPGAACPGWPQLVELGVPGFDAPAVSGGFDLGLGASAMVCEELGRLGLGGPYRDVALAADLLRAVPGLQEWPAGIAAGTVTAAAGTPDGAAVVLSTDNGWKISGTWEIDDADADLLLLTLPADAVTGTSAGSRGTPLTGAGDTVVPLPRNRPGLRFEMTADGTARLYLDGVVVRREEAVPVPDGLLARRRVRQAAYLLGVATGAHEEASAYTTRRRQFGVPLSDHQAVAFALAALKARLIAAGLVVRRAAALADQGRTAARAAVDALALTAELALETTRTAVHVCGVHGLTAELGVQRHYRLARVEAVRLGPPQRLWREAARLRLEGAPADLDLLTDLSFTARGPHTG